MSIGRLTASAFSGALENTLALAHLNFDFSLIKIQAPAEYEEVGLSLSKQRSEAAENGISHITARKLGALFEELVPDTPKLFRAYGLRASKIINDPKLNPRGSHEDGIFADHIGADATTIWAAATSGSAAIATHLLACMLARIWSPGEATSIWSEIVMERKRILSRLDENEPRNFSSIAASRIQLDRDQLASWDAGARAWLSIADEAFSVAQTQLSLIINNLDIPVSTQLLVFDGVIQTWQDAMLTVEKILDGESQSIQTGAPLLGLSAWHLYPDMLVLGDSLKEINQKDSLIPAGSIVTLGLQGKKILGKGVYWSLPLAHLCFYGDPVVSEGALSATTRKVSIDQFLYVTLGSLISHWLRGSSDVKPAIQLISHVASLLEKERPGEGLEPGEHWHSTWLRTLASVCEEYLRATGERFEETNRLIQCGHRRYSSFIASPTSMSASMSAFGLTTTKTLFSLLRGTEEKIFMLRRLSSTMSQSSSFFIQYKVGKSWECATVAAFHRTPENFPNIHIGPVRWIPDKSSSKTEEWEARCKQIESLGEQAFRVPLADFPDFGQPFFEGLHVPDFLEARTPPNLRSASSAKLKSLFDTKEGEVMLFAFDSIPVDYKESQDSRKCHSSSSSENSGEDYSFKKHLHTIDGNDFDNDESIEGIDSINSSVPLAVVNMAFTDGLVSAQELEKHLLGKNWWFNLPLFDSLRAVSTVASLYQLIPQARIPLQAANRPILNAKWAAGGHRSNKQDSNPERKSGLRRRKQYNNVPILSAKEGHPRLAHGNFVLTLEEQFACLLYFESGGLDVEPDSLRGVMAMSSGNSLYITNRLLRDPWKKIDGNQIQRVIGNVGRPGIALMTSPRNVRMRELDHDKWVMINHHPFDGQRSNSFHQTTLHLGFTDYVLPVDIGDHGKRDVQVYFLEATVSVHDRGDWVGDIDVLGCLESPQLVRFPGDLNTCEKNHGLIELDARFSTLATIDNWEELIDAPKQVAVLRAHGNWQARLAAAALSIQKGYTTGLLPIGVCWPCMMDVLETGIKQNRSPLRIFVSNQNRGTLEYEEKFKAAEKLKLPLQGRTDKRISPGIYIA